MRGIWRAGMGRVAAEMRRTARKLLLGRRFLQTLERNREAADLLDLALKEMLER